MGSVAISFYLSIARLSRDAVVDVAPRYLPDPEVDQADERREDDDRHHDHERVSIQLGRRWPDDLSQLVVGIAKEPGDPDLIGSRLRQRHAALLGLPVRGVLPAPAAILAQLQPVRIVLLVLDSRVVATFAVAALKRDDRLHTGPFAFVLGGRCGPKNKA